MKAGTCEGLHPKEQKSSPDRAISEVGEIVRAAHREVVGG